jgi:hypothetical protein
VQDAVTLAYNVFAYEQLRDSKRSLVKVHEQLYEAQTLAPPKARHCLYSVLATVLIIILLIDNRLLINQETGLGVLLNCGSFQ